MSKQEFIRGLQASLYGNVSEAQISDCVRYYESYFHTEISKGRTEHEICEELGDPHLIARSIIDVSGVRDDNMNTYTEYDDEAQYSYDPQAHYERSYDQSYDQRNVYEDMQRPIHILSGWKAILLIVMILFGVFAVIAVLTSITISLLPLLLPVIVVVLILRLFFY